MGGNSACGLLFIDINDPRGPIVKDHIFPVIRHLSSDHLEVDYFAASYSGEAQINRRYHR